MNRASLAVIALAGLACAAELEPEIDSVELASTISVTPFAASNGVDTSLPQDAELAYPGSSSKPGSGRLVVFLHGKGAQPLGYQALLQEANAQGFHVVALSYWNIGLLPGSPKMVELCGIDGTCSGKVRREIFDCTDQSPLVAVPPRACIRDRLDTLLHHLAAHYPGQGWSDFITQGNPWWARIVLVGHSFGSGMAAWIGQRRAVHRVVMIAGPGDSIDLPGSPPPDWVYAPFQPPIADLYGFQHFDDATADYDIVTHIWSIFGMLGNHYCVDATCVNLICAPSLGQYCDSRQLTTFRDVSNPHNDVARDPSYAPTWRYLLTHDL